MLLPGLAEHLHAATRFPAGLKHVSNAACWPGQIRTTKLPALCQHLCCAACRAEEPPDLAELLALLHTIDRS